MPIVDLDRIQPDYLKSLRDRWKTVKAKHADALKAKKITFAKDLGPLLDKRPPLYKAIRAWKQGDSLLVIKSKYTAIVSNAKELKTTIASYQKKIVGLGDPAEEELNEVLTQLLRDAVKVDEDYTAGMKKKK